MLSYALVLVCVLLREGGREEEEEYLVAQAAAQPRRNMTFHKRFLVGE